jgi:hypothetical protein
MSFDSRIFGHQTLEVATESVEAGSTIVSTYVIDLSVTRHSAFCRSEF